MFRTPFASIIRNTTNCSNSRWFTIVYRVPDDGRKGRPKHVEFLTPNKKHKKISLVGIHMIIITKLHGPKNIKFLLVVFSTAQ